MSNLEILHFEQLKNEVQAQYLKKHTPSYDDISKWKGIDIIYFQEDLRKIAKGNISEKTFYTYFKSSNNSKLPRIDMLNLLSIYAGYMSWYDFKKNHLFADEILKESEKFEISVANENDESIEINEKDKNELKNVDNPPKKVQIDSILQINDTDIQNIKEKNTEWRYTNKQDRKNFVKDRLWVGISSILLIIVGFLGFKDQIMTKEYTYKFIDADRNSKINADLDVKILKENESPIYFKVMPNQPFVYTTKSKDLTMVVSSPYYKTDTIQRNLEAAAETENIELKPNDYAIMLYYYSKSIKDLKRKRESLNYLISDNALIYQVYDNEKYGVETMDKQRYISLVTLPTTSLENLQVIDTKDNKDGKIVMIKFRIGTSDENKNK